MTLTRFTCPTRTAFVPVLPELLPQRRWLRDTSLVREKLLALLGQKRGRNAALLRLDAALDVYDQSRVQFESLRVGQPVPDFANESIRRAYEKAVADFKHVEKEFVNWGPGHERRNKRDAVTQLRERLFTGAALIQRYELPKTVYPPAPERAAATDRQSPRPAAERGGSRTGPRERASLRPSEPVLEMRYE